MELPTLKIKDLEVKYPIIQGGMGIGISGYLLAGSVSKEGGLGVCSSAALDRVVGKRYARKFNIREACSLEVQDAKKISGGKPIGMNIMVAVQRHYEDSVLGSMDGGVDAIISGAGLPMRLPEIVEAHPRSKEVKLIPIASSGRAFELICKRWQRSNRLPDAVVVEGPLAGGHLAWRTREEIADPKNLLENLVIEVLEVAKRYGDIPVIAAGGIFSHEDIVKFINMGCKGVQMGTRFLGTHESGATPDFKKSLVEATEEDIDVADRPGSPCQLLFRVIKTCPFYEQALKGERKAKCDKGYVLINGKCAAKEDNVCSFCICNGLLSATGVNESSEEKELYSVGSNAFKIKEIISVADLMKELTGA